MYTDCSAPTHLHNNALNVAQLIYIMYYILCIIYNVPNICNLTNFFYNICFQSDISDGQILLALNPTSDKLFFVLTNFPLCHVTTFYIATVIIGYETGLMLVSFICLGYTRLEAERPTGTLTPAY